MEGRHGGILGACGTTTMHNSYGGASPFPSDILGTPTNIRRLMLQSNLNWASGIGQQVYTNTASLGRVEVLVDTSPGNYARKFPYGAGCYEEFASFYETFVSTPIDLSGTSLRATYDNTTDSYTVTPVASSWHTPTSTPVAFNDDQVQQRTLGWTLPYPGGTTTDLWISSNGFIYLTGLSGSSGCCSGNANSLLSSFYGPRWAGLWNDLNPGPSGGGSIYVESFPATRTCFVTFDQVPRYGTSDLNTFQYVFEGNGNVELRYGTCQLQTSTTLIGWSPGAGNEDPGRIDLSGLSTLVVPPVDTLPLTLAADIRPVLGSTVNLTVGNVPSTALLKAVIHGLTKYDPGQPLAGFGMPACEQYCSMDSVALLLGSTSSHPFSVPNGPAGTTRSGHSPATASISPSRRSEHRTWAAHGLSYQ